MSNRLAGEKSPYLLQHAGNPVQWYPWGEEAFQAARESGRPIFLSAGYSTCHWCHVMERECFENEAIAAQMNEGFINIKLDREERPDVDRLYMTYVQGTTGSGGWPLSVFLTPDLQPFYGGTYFPPVPHPNRVSFPDLLGALSKAWREDRAGVLEAAANSTLALQQMAASTSPGDVSVSWEALYHACFSHIQEGYDSEWGGFGGVPKFPRPVVHDFLHAYYAWSGADAAVAMSRHTLKMMAERGMNDQLGGGFHRYSVDRRWMVPHFEKMLYDQAQLVTANLEMYQLTGEANFARCAEATLKYVWRDLAHVEGAFFAGEDADSREPGASHAREGAFYVWTRAEVLDLLGPEDGVLFCDFYGVLADGNAPGDGDPAGEFHGKNILYEVEDLGRVARRNGSNLKEALSRMERSCEVLLEARARRPRPHRDEKIIGAWNGLMISAFARAATALDSHRFARIATGAADWVWREMWDGQRLCRHWKEGPAPVLACADDYAALAKAHLDLYECTFLTHHLERATLLLESLHRHFWDEESGGYFGASAETDLLARFKEDYDGAEPSANALAAWSWAKLAHLTGHEEALVRAQATCRAFGPHLAAVTGSMPLLLRAHMLAHRSPQHLVICGEPEGEDTLALLRCARESFRPFLNLILLGAASQDILATHQPFLAAMTPLEGRATAYFCDGYACQRPVTSVEELQKALGPVPNSSSGVA